MESGRELAHHGPNMSNHVSCHLEEIYLLQGSKGAQHHAYRR